MDEAYANPTNGNDMLPITTAAIIRIRRKLRNQRQLMLWSAVAAAIWVIAAFLIDLIIVDIAWPMVVGVLLIFGWLAVYSKWIMPMRVTVTCPNCDELINLNKDWVCGACDDEKSPVAMQTYVRHSIPFENCDECRAVANLIECPHCTALAVTEQYKPDGDETVARFL